MMIFFPRHAKLFARRTKKRLAQLARARQGVAAVEFAMLSPLFIFIYLMSFQMTVGFSVANNASRAASTIADLVTQEETTDVSDLADMYSLAKAIMTPYSTDSLHIKVTGISVDANGDETVSWSWQDDGTAPYAAGADIELPDDLQQASSFVVHAEITTDYNYFFFAPMMTSVADSTINISRDFYFRQRIGDNVACSDCP